MIIGILGCRGIRHSLKFVDDFKSELYLIKQVINSNKNVHLIFHLFQQL
jgi:hypothetical protein